MFSPLTSERLRKARLAPMVTISVPIDWFKGFGITFEQGEDDLDSYRFVGLEIADPSFACGLLRYDNGPASETVLLLPEQLSDSEAIHAAVLTFAKEFDMSLDLFHWNVGGEGVSIQTAA